ncbi:hypothetical protein PILCRDRAFT_541592 [Piloderma croceum F 1598]|uniref:Uncharacterized protein n=1 Tax=Piloderma croceum (strain F 1598) TaxID=765440 RepID=A0A0C3B176_PILCF|nr:hypothetical protein PILCRDRAFT_541592 [Piloderma croceum F 1598]
MITIGRYPLEDVSDQFFLTFPSTKVSYIIHSKSLDPIFIWIISTYALFTPNQARCAVHDVTTHPRPMRRLPGPSRNITSSKVVGYCLFNRMRSRIGYCTTIFQHLFEFASRTQIEVEKMPTCSFFVKPLTFSTAICHGIHGTE